MKFKKKYEDALDRVITLQSKNNNLKEEIQKLKNKSYSEKYKLDNGLMNEVPSNE